jgi:hypothetical protein
MFCRSCQKQIFSERESFAAISGGGRGLPNGSDSDYVGFLKLVWRAPPQIGGRLLSENVVREDEQQDGQFDLYYCSIQCLRNQLDLHLDSLAKRSSELLESHNQD